MLSAHEGDQAEHFPTTRYNPIVLHSCRQGGEPCRICRQWDNVEKEIQYADALLQKSLEERESLKLEFNHQYDPVGGRLPVEVVCRIFGFCLPEPLSADDFENPSRVYDIQERARRVQLNLGGVCHTWRTIAWSYQPLWDHIYISMHLTTQPSRIELFREWVARSGQLPLTVIINVHRFSNGILDCDIISPFMDPLVTLLNSVVHRCSLLLATMPASCIERLRLQPDCQSLLEGLAVQPSDGQIPFQHEHRLTLGTGASPRVLLLYGVGLENVDLGWGNVEVFLGDSFTAIECIEIIRRAPQLIDCYLDNVRFKAISVFTDIVHSNLQSIHIDHCAQIFSYLTLPYLQKLHCNLESRTFAIILREFVIRSRCPLHTAVLTNLSRNDQDLIEFLSLLPSLETLELLDSDVGSGFFRKFGNTFYASPEDGINFLPNLEIFRFSGPRSFPWPDIPFMAPKPPTGVDNVLQRPLEYITFDLWEEKVTFIDKDSLEGIVNGMNTSVAVTIQDDNHNSVDLIAQSQAYHLKAQEDTA